MHTTFTLHLDKPVHGHVPTKRYNHLQPSLHLSHSYTTHHIKERNNKTRTKTKQNSRAYAYLSHNWLSRCALFARIVGVNGTPQTPHCFDTSRVSTMLLQSALPILSSSSDRVMLWSSPIYPMLSVVPAWVCSRVSQTWGTIRALRMGKGKIGV